MSVVRAPFVTTSVALLEVAVALSINAEVVDVKLKSFRSKTPVDVVIPATVPLKLIDASRMSVPPPVNVIAAELDAEPTEAPLDSSSDPPLIAVLIAVPPEKTTSVPPLSTVVLVAVAPAFTYCVPPAPMVVLVALP
jgi:hypothetical protein